jgi:hypothetical protein
METNTPTLNIPTESWQLPTDNKQNGFSNYATWRVYQSIAEEDAIYWNWIARAATCANTDADDCTITSVLTHPTVALATELESAFYHSPLFKDFGVYTDLLFTAMAMVEWREIARILFRELIEGVICMSAYDERASVSDGRTRFSAGAVVASTAVVELLTPKTLVNAVIRHRRGDWGVYAERNERALSQGLPIVSVYRLYGSVELHIETDADRIRTDVTLA